MFCLCTPEYGTFQWSMVDLTGAISLKKWILLCQKSIAPQIGIGAHESLPPHAGMLTAFLVLWAHEWRDPVMSRRQGLGTPWPLTPTHLSAPSSKMPLWALEKACRAYPRSSWARHSLASEPVMSFWVSHHPWYKETSLMKYESYTNLGLGLLCPLGPQWPLEPSGGRGLPMNLGPNPESQLVPTLNL